MSESGSNVAAINDKRSQHNDADKAQTTSVAANTPAEPHHNAITTYSISTNTNVQMNDSKHI